MGDGMIGILKKVHPRQVIWVLLCTLIAVLLWVGNMYCDRVEALEGIHKDQNGKVVGMVDDVKDLVDSVKGMDEKLDRVETEQAAQKTDIDWIKRTLNNR
jgi:hypothetical protein